MRKRGRDETVSQVRKYELITPLFGGGVEPGFADPVTVIRGASIRGQLRFWWRACRAAEYTSVGEMKANEDKIWGSTKQPSSVIIEVFPDQEKVITPETAFQVVIEDGKRKVKASQKIAPYAAFPLLPDKDEQKQICWKSEDVLVGVGFTLSLRYPQSLQFDVQAATWAWETFGGIGARTRRGFGTLRLLSDGGGTHDLPADPVRIEQIIGDQLKKYVADGSGGHGVPKLPRRTQSGNSIAIKVTNVRSNATESWKYLTDRLNNFRQARYGGKYGLSQWPEANEIRRRTHNPPKIADDAPDGDLVRKFPRAVFGLPIIFHMPHDPGVPDITLRGGANDRFASPLVLRPLACAGGKAVGLALILEGQPHPPRGLWLDGFTFDDPVVDYSLTLNEARRVPPLQGNQNVLQAFLKILR
jgi:CRISPR-associated protein Cmr1